MSKFKVGDKVVGNAKASKRYVVTGTGYGATVTRLTAQGEIQLNDVWFVDPECFDLIKSVNPTTYELHITCNDGKTTNAIYKVNGKIEKRTQAICAPSDTFDFAAGAQTALDRVFPKAQPTQPIAPQEDKAKFKVGQKVKVIGNCCCHGYSRGTILTLVRSVNFLRREPDWYVGEGTDYVSERDIEPYAEPEKEPEPVYYSGKVVCTENENTKGFWTVGKVYEFKNGYAMTDCGEKSPVYGAPINALSEYAGVKFIPYLGEA